MWDVDIGFSDVINPGTQKLTYPVLLEGMEAPVIEGYPAESIISEKFHAMVNLGEINSRMKDFYDIWMLSEALGFDGEVLQNAISETFKRRQTEIPQTTPLALMDDFANENERQWRTFVTKNKLTQEEVRAFPAVLARLRLFLLPPVEAINAGILFERHWVAGGDWE